MVLDAAAALAAHLGTAAGFGASTPAGFGGAAAAALLEEEEPFEDDEEDESELLSISGKSPSVPEF